MNKKGYNNQKDWEQFYNEPNTQHIAENVLDTEIEEVKDDNIFEVEEVTDEDDENILDQNDKEDFGEVLSLTEYMGGGTVRDVSQDFVVAEYNKIDTQNIDKQTQLVAKKFVSKITKFILEFNDVQLDDAHKNYIKQVGALQLSNLQDLLTLIEINKQMISNIVARVNATQAEDYTIINSYNNLLNQHLKLIKEVTTMYKSIPSVMKKMRADILSNQELENQNNENEELITENYGEKQFNNSKQLLRTILNNRKKEETSE